MVPGRLSRYVARRVLASVAIVLAAVAFLAILIDAIEFIRRFGGRDGFSTLDGVAMAAMNAPLLVQTILPFAFLFGAMLALLGMSKRLELVVARASGVSVWRFMSAPILLALALGSLSSVVLHPVASRLEQRADAMEASFSSKNAPRDAKGRWFRLNGRDGAAIFYARHVGDDPASLVGVTVFGFDAAGRFREKAIASAAEFEAGRWLLHDATVMPADKAPFHAAAHVFQTDLTRDELHRSISGSGPQSIWSLPTHIRTGERLGQKTDPARMEFHLLLGRPLFLAAMVMIAATVSLRLFRQGGTGPLVVAGVAAGFLLYVLTEVMRDLGSNGIVNPVMAAWAPSIIALTFGATALLYQEDG